MAEQKAPNRNSRDSESHDKSPRRKPWTPVRKLDTPPAPPGYTYRWIRESMLGQEDRANVSRRLREGWELVRGTDLPSDWPLPTADDHSRHAGIVYNEGLLLAKIPNETVAERRAYYEGKSADAVNALDNNMFSESRRDGQYVKYDPQRDTQVSFGKK
jgi:hypothetical protein